MTGYTGSFDFPATPDAFDTSYNGGYDVVVLKLNNNLTSLLSSTFIGGNNSDEARSIGLAPGGYVYISGQTYSAGYYYYPTTAGAYDTSHNGYYDTFVSKFDSNLTSLLSSTFLGGTSFSEANSMVIDAEGNILVTGYTNSTDYPTTPGAYNTSINSLFYDVFVTKLNSNLTSLVSSTFIGGTSEDYGQSIAIDPGGNIFITGYTVGYSSYDYPTTPGAYDTSRNGGTDVVVSKLNNNLTSLLSSTLLGGAGGSGGDIIYSSVIDSGGNLFITGYTSSPGYPVTPGTYNASGGNVFVSKFDNTLTNLLASTFIGGGYGNGISIDSSGNIFVTGLATSSSYPTTPGAYDTSFNGVWDVFVSKLDNSLSSLLASTFLGGSSDEQGYSVAIDPEGNIFVTGDTYSSNYPVTSGAYNPSYSPGYYEVFVSKLDHNLSSLLASTYVGKGSGFALAIDSSENIFVIGRTDSSNYPTTPGAYDTSYNGSYDLFVSKFNNNLSSLLASTYLGGGNSDEGYSIAIDFGGNIFITGYTWASDFPTTPGAYDTSYNGPYGDAFVSKFNNTLSSLLASTLLGASNVEDVGNSIAIDSGGNIFLSGKTFSTGYYPYPTTPGAYDTSFNGVSDAFVTKLNNNLSSLLSSTFLGGSNADSGESIAIDSGGNIFVAGLTGSSDFPSTPGAYDTSYNGNGDVFISKLDSNLSGEPPTAITLSSFTAKAKGKKVILNWATGTEINNVGFNILRSESENGEYVKINEKIIKAKGSSTHGAVYKFKDTSVEPGKTYWYKLEDIDSTTGSTQHGPVKVEVGGSKKKRK